MIYNLLSTFPPTESREKRLPGIPVCVSFCAFKVSPEAKTRALQMKCLRRIYRALVKACQVLECLCSVHAFFEVGLSLSMQIGIRVT